MNQSFSHALLLFSTCFIAIGCSFNSMTDPDNAEVIYEPSVIEDSEAFDVFAFTNRSGYKSIAVDHTSFAFTDYYALYSPASNLKMVLAGCSECCSMAGYKIEYDNEGKVREVIAVEDVDSNNKTPYYSRIASYKDNTAALKKWMLDKSMERNHYEIVRNEYGQVTAIGSVQVSPYYYTAKYFIKEWGPFWSSDVNGGKLAFFVLLEAKNKENCSSVDYLYADDHLVAELAYWNGVFIKALYYNQEGHFDGISEDRSTDVFEDSYWHYHNTGVFQWYL